MDQEVPHAPGLVPGDLLVGRPCFLANARGRLADDAQLLENGASNQIVSHEVLTPWLVKSREKEANRLSRLKDIGQVEIVTPRHR
jgi:hypothetical protein